MPTTVLRGGHVLGLTDGTWRAADVMIDDGTITAVGADLTGPAPTSSTPPAGS